MDEHNPIPSPRQNRLGNRQRLKKTTVKKWTDFCTRQCQCQAESFTGAGFQWGRRKSLRMIRKNLRDNSSCDLAIRKDRRVDKARNFQTDASVLVAYCPA
jgi:hypothetical protein